MKLPHIHRWHTTSEQHYDDFYKEIQHYKETQHCKKCGLMRQWDSCAQYFVYYRLTGGILRLSSTMTTSTRRPNSARNVD